MSKRAAVKGLTKTKKQTEKQKAAAYKTKLTPLEKKLTRQLFRAEVYEQLYHAKLKGHRGARYKAVIGQYGPLKGAKQLLKSKRKINVSKWKQYSIENLVVKKRFRSLFNEKQIKEARERLAK